MKSYGDEVTDFYHKEIAHVVSNYTWVKVISLDSTPKKNKNYYPRE